MFVQCVLRAGYDGLTMYTIKRAAELTGVAEATLRAWERRYGVVRPGRTEAGYRVYDEADLTRIRQMSALLGQGWAPRQAAARVAGVGGVGAAGVGEAIAGSVPGSAEFVAAAAALDAAALSAVVQQALEATSFEVFVETWLMPVLTDLGVAWSRGEVSVGGEHMAANAVLRRLAAVFDAETGPAEGLPVLVGLPPGAHHELGVFSFATLARRRGLSVLYAGADLPVQDWVEVATRHAASAAVLAVPMPDDVTPAQQTVDALRAALPDLVVAVGGGYQEQVQRAQWLGQPLDGAVVELLGLLARRHQAVTPSR